MSKSTYAANNVIDLQTGRTAFSLPTTYLALYTSSPGIGGSANTNETSYSGYARVALGTGGSSKFSAAASSATNNPAQVNFGQVAVAPVTITHVAIVDTSSGAGNILVFAALASPVTYQVGDTPNFAALQLALSES